MVELRHHGSRVMEKLGGIETAVMGEAGQAGHGCGHNLLGSAVLLAATAVKDWLVVKGLPGRVRYYGCPAEEGGAAKAFFVRDGIFDYVDIAISWHPSSIWEVAQAAGLAGTRTDFTVSGKAAHAAALPHLGRSALGAQRRPGHARVRYSIRRCSRADMAKLVERVKKIAQGTALMTETTVETRSVSAVSDLPGNRPLKKAMHAIMEELGPPSFDDADRASARQLRTTLTDCDIAAIWTRRGAEDIGAVLADFTVPLDVKRAPKMDEVAIGHGHHRDARAHGP